MRIAMLGTAYCLFAANQDVRAAEFIRADTNQDGKLDISDPVATLGVLFLGGVAPTCFDALDSNDDGATDLSDAVHTLSFLFSGGQAPPAPYPECGEDSTPDDLSCDGYAACKPPVACFGQSDLDIALSIANETPGCFTELKQSLDFVTVTFCLEEEAAPCGPDGDLGCGIDYSDMIGTLDVAEREIVLEFRMDIDALPTRIEEFLFGMTYYCHTDFYISGELHIPFTTTVLENGSRAISEILQGDLQMADYAFIATGEAFCDELTHCDLIVPGCNPSAFFVDAIEGDPKSFLMDLGLDLEGAVLCE